MARKHYRIIILDFDGVLVESNAIKDRAFETVFAEYPGQMQEILAYHRSTTIIRFQKFRHIVEKILRRVYTPELEQQLARKFSGFCIKEISVCPWVAGAPEFLSSYAGRLPLYLVSINPMEDLKAILANRRMEGFFKEVYTAEKSKAPQLRDILKREGLLPAEAVFIGDAVSDYTSAKEAGVDFIGRRSSKELSLPDVPVFDDFHGIMPYIKTHTLCPTT